MLADVELSHGALSAFDYSCYACLYLFLNRSKLNPQAADQEVVSQLVVLWWHYSAKNDDFKSLELVLLVLLGLKGDIRFLKVPQKLDNVTFNVLLVKLTDFSLRVAMGYEVQMLKLVENLKCFKPDLSGVFRQISVELVCKGSMLFVIEVRISIFKTEAPKQLDIAWVLDKVLKFQVVAGICMVFNILDEALIV